jgi:septal ring factor EnvC (AmiA/AmiB activator)
MESAPTERSGNGTFRGLRARQSGSKLRALQTLRAIPKRKDTCLPNSLDPGILMHAMKNRLGLIALILGCLGLGVAVILIKTKATEEKKAATETILDLSNKLVYTSGKWEEEKNNATLLYKDLEAQKKALGELTNTFTEVSATLDKTKATLDKTQASLEASEKEVAKRDAKIGELEAQNQALDKQAMDLSSSITNLTVQIASTQKKLAASEGDKAFLEKELKRLMAEKAELERQFNDLTVLRAQVAKLKEELNIARRIEWIRQGLFASSEQKGAQKLMQGLNAPQGAQAKAPKPTYDLNVEVSADGSVKVIPPPTNAPAAK